MTAREQATLLRAIEQWRKAVKRMAKDQRGEAALAGLIVNMDEVEALRGRIERGEIQ